MRQELGQGPGDRCPEGQDEELEFHLQPEATRGFGREHRPPPTYGIKRLLSTVGGKARRRIRGGGRPVRTLWHWWSCWWGAT